ncbi:MAG: radical SAM protein [Proteobacteria bacterium]|nr:radical SAM protein [Pseudomonadota bacterium]
MKRLKALLINPYIYDFSAYSYWSTPLGLLYLGSVLRKNGMEIKLIDCLRVEENKRKEDGRAPFIKERVNKPQPLKGIRKRLKRYGISKEVLIKELSSVESPDLILITSIMTYWYAGAKEVSDATRNLFPGAKIVIGGIYPSLCYEHALKAMTSADLIVKNNEINSFYGFIEKELTTALSYKPDMYDLDNLPYPCFDLYYHIPFVPLLTSYGCTYKCTYCATPYMHPNIVRRKPESTADEILFWHNYGLNSFVIYDDNFLFNKELFAKPLLRHIIELPFPVKIYNPNALNAALVDEELAFLLLGAGFKDIRIGLETVNPLIQKSTGGKVNPRTFENALSCLIKAGFPASTISIYMLAGLPFQKWEDVKTTIDYITDFGVRAHIAEYTPIPHTSMFDEFKSFARYPLTDDPAYQNNALFPFAWQGFTENDLMFLKQYAREKNANVDKTD